MHLVAYIVLSMAFGIANMLLFHRCAEAFSSAAAGSLTLRLRLSRGLVVTFLVALVQALLFLLGMFVGDLLRFELPADASAFSKTNALVFLGLAVFVMLRMLMPYLKREPKLPLFNLGSNAACAAMAFATGINLLLTGLGTGFVASLSSDLHKALWPMLIVMFLAGYWGLMLGRSKVSIRPKVWMIVASLLMLAVAFFATITA